MKFNPRLHRAAAAALLAGMSAAAWAQSDSCASATLAVPFTYTGNTATATNDGVAGCVGSTGPDQWFRVVPSQTRQLVVTTCGEASWDTVLSIHSGCPGTGANAIACNDDSCGLQSRVTATVVAGQTYYIRIGGYDATAAGTYRITFSYEDPPMGSAGPDVWIARFTDVGYYATVGEIASYAIGTDACNRGDTPAEWQADNPRHPVIAQNMYRLMNGRFEQIGQSWLKHGFASTNSATCGTCQQPPGGGSQLGPMCSDAYGSGLNGSQGNLGPRSQVNATTGVFPYPWTAPGYSGEIARRIQVKTADLTPAQNPGAIYFGECHYITQDDAQWGNGLNNSSYQRLAFPSVSSPSFTGAIVPMQPAVHAWQANDTDVMLTPMDYTEPNPSAARGPITARFWVGSKVVDNGDGTWSYEYAVQNFNSNRAGGSFTIPLPSGAHLTNIGFTGVPSHSGEPYDNAPWTSTVTPFGITFRPAAFTPAQNANAIRWGTLYNFRFTTDVRPALTNASIDLFSPGPAGAAVAVGGTVNGPDLYVCRGDFNHDGAFDGADIGAFFDAFEAGVPSADVNQDGGVDGGDVESFFVLWSESLC